MVRFTEVKQKGKSTNTKLSSGKLLYVFTSLQRKVQVMDEDLYFRKLVIFNVLKNSICNRIIFSLLVNKHTKSNLEHPSGSCEAFTQCYAFNTYKLYMPLVKMRAPEYYCLNRELHGFDKAKIKTGKSSNHLGNCSLLLLQLQYGKLLCLFSLLKDKYYSSKASCKRQKGRNDSFQSKKHLQSTKAQPCFVPPNTIPTTYTSSNGPTTRNIFHPDRKG